MQGMYKNRMQPQGSFLMKKVHKDIQNLFIIIRIMVKKKRKRKRKSEEEKKKVSKPLYFSTIFCLSSKTILITAVFVYFTFLISCPK